MNKLINHFFRSILLFLITSVILVSCVFESKENKSTNQLTIVVKGKESVSTYKHVDLRFIINTGSLSEQDNEKGFAHLIEHLAFNDTVKYPNETLIPLLEKSGIRLGFHSNATTSFDKTVYRLNLKDPNPQKLELAIDVLSQWAMHVQFNQKTINAEKPVIKEEWRGFQPDEKSWRKQAFKSEFAKSHYLNRLPIGDMDIIESAEAKDLEAFYKRWYQPQNAAVIVTGNIDETQVNKLIDKYFGEWKNTNTSVETNYALSINAIPNTQIISDTNVNGSFTTLNYYTANSRAKTTLPVYQATIASQRLMYSK